MDRPTQLLARFMTMQVCALFSLSNADSNQAECPIALNPLWINETQEIQRGYYPIQRWGFPAVFQIQSRKSVSEKIPVLTFAFDTTWGRGIWTAKLNSNLKQKTLQYGLVWNHCWVSARLGHKADHLPKLGAQLSRALGRYISARLMVSHHLTQQGLTWGASFQFHSSGVRCTNARFLATTPNMRTPLLTLLNSRCAVYGYDNFGSEMFPKGASYEATEFRKAYFRRVFMGEKEYKRIHEDWNQIEIRELNREERETEENYLAQKAKNRDCSEKLDAALSDIEKREEALREELQTLQTWLSQLKAMSGLENL